MSEGTLDQITPILPLDFFQVSVDVHPVEDVRSPLKKIHQLPDFSDYLFEDSFAAISVGWHEKGLKWEFKVASPFEECFFPDWRKGDSLEVWIDTRDLESAGFITRFCHHFVILSKPVDDFCAYEVTAFRGNESHDLCEPRLLKVESLIGKKSYTIQFFLPSESLHGYDPSAFDRFGCAFRINRFKETPMHFALSSDYWDIESQPSLWCSMQMRKR